MAVDLPGIRLTDWVWDWPQRRSREVILREREVRTIYLGAKRADTLVVYNKGKQAPLLAGGAELTRVEFRASNVGLAKDLMSLSNPLTKVIVFNTSSLALPEPHRRALMSVGHLRGRHGILADFPKPTQLKIEHGLMQTCPNWWNPAKIWAQWHDCVAKMIPVLCDPDGSHLSSAQAFAFALDAEAHPEKYKMNCNRLQTDVPISGCE